ncbi:MAG: phosphoribosylglycinamide formyltransferase [Flavitalea sp.]
MTRIAVFASGTGSNAQKLIEYFTTKPGESQGKEAITVTLIACNKPHAGVLNIAAKANIETLMIDREKFFHGNAYTDELDQKRVDFIVLAGFLWKIPSKLVEAYPRKIFNIHPALLPSYGGKGMYGAYVHEAVLKAKDAFSGITIHYVDEHYDNGDIIFQAKCEITPTDTPQSLAEKIHRLEHEYYPRIIEKEINGQKHG